MFKKIMTSILLFFAAGNFTWAFDQLEGDVTLNNNTVLTEKFGQIRGDFSLDGGQHSLDGAGFFGITSPKGTTTTSYNTVLKNIGFFTLNEISSADENSIIKLIDGKPVHFSIQDTESAHGFLGSTGSGSFAYTQDGISLENSVIKNNHIVTSSYGAGGAIANESKDKGIKVINSFITENSIKRENSTSSNRDVRGGAISDGGTPSYNSSVGGLVVKDSVITNNSIINNQTNYKYKSLGGALYEMGGAVNIDNTYLGGNYIEADMGAYGGALYAGAPKADIHMIKNSVFKDNHVKSKNYAAAGGAVNIVSNSLEAQVISDSLFKNNSAVSESNQKYTTEAGALGGAINNEAANLSINNSAFENNKAVSNKFALGGAIYTGSTNNKILKIDNSLFEDNKVQSLLNATQGGAVYSGTNTVISNSFFKGNIAGIITNFDDTSSARASSGGAIAFNTSAKDALIENTDFVENSAVNTTKGGGAIYTNGKTNLTIIDSSFKDNTTYGIIGKTDSASPSGGAIYNDSTQVNIIAKDKDVYFSGNKAGDDSLNLVSNAIHDNAGTINIAAYEDRQAVFNDSITSEDNKSTLNLNSLPPLPEIANAIAKDSSPLNGTIVLNKDMSGYKGSVNLEGGTLALGQNGTLFENAASFNVNAPSKINLANGVIQEHHFNNLNINADVNLGIDADLEKGAADNFEVDNFTITDSAKIKIDTINVIADATADSAAITLMDSEEARKYITLEDTAKQALGKIYKYGVEFNEETGELEFQKLNILSAGSSNPSNFFNPAILATPVALQAVSQAGIREAMNYGFEHSDMFTKLPKKERLAKINANKYAISEFNNQLPGYDEQLEESGFWLRPYSVLERIDLEDGPKVDNISYGTLVGYDSKFKENKNGWVSSLSSYLSYYGSMLDYSNVDISTNGFGLGFTKSFYKKNFWSAISASGGMSLGRIDASFGDDDIISANAGVSLRNGYNLEFGEGRFIIQPTTSFSYYFANIFDYTNAAGVKIDAKPLNSFELKPGLRLISNTKNGWQPYISAHMVWNLFNETDVRADGVRLPDMHMKPYVEYGLGIQKNKGDNFTCFLQAMARSGGRTGGAFTAGLRWAVGRDRRETL